MIGAAVQRFRSMPREELSWRLRAVRRVHQERVSTALRRPEWRRSDVRHVLASATLDADMRRAIDSEDWMSVHRRLAASIQKRPSRFPLDSHGTEALRGEILARWPDAAANAAARADRVLAGRYDLLGYRDLKFAIADDSSTIWHRDPVHGGSAPMVFWADVRYLDPGYGDHKIIWELNRHQHWMMLGRAFWLTREERYAGGIVRELRSWLDANPPLVGMNWASMLELGLRCLSWLWALSFLLGDGREASDEPEGESGPWLVDMLVAIDRQLAHVANHLSYYFSPNTHLTGEALALYVVGHALPELARSAEWVDAGRQILLSELDSQVCRDGGHAERSTHYHRYTLDFYLMALLVAEHVGDEEAATRIREVCLRLATFMRELADERGCVPQIGDDDGGTLWTFTGRPPTDVRDSLALASVALDQPALAPWGPQEEAFWMGWNGYAAELTAARPEAPTASDDAGCRHTVFRETGYVVMRDRAGGHLVFDTGPHGYLNSGHAHADTLAVTLGIDGQPFLIDPGTATYTMDPAVRDRMRSSAWHNTLTIDGRSSSVPAGPFHWRTKADARLAGACGNAGFSWAEASHDGYESIAHRRSVFHTPGSGWWIFDEILGEGRHHGDLHWHFDPLWHVARDGKAVRANGPGGRVAWLLHDCPDLSLVHGTGTTELGWCSPVYGALVPTWNARVSLTSAAPFSMATWIGACGLEPKPVLERTGDAVRVRCGETEWRTLVRPAANGTSSADAILECQTDARLLHYELRHGAVTAVAAVDFIELALAKGALRITSDERLSDLHASISGTTLDLHSSVPPRQLRLEGAIVANLSLVRLNGRPRNRRSPRRTDRLVLTASDWAQACVASPASLT